MTTPFASGKKSISECDRCGFQYDLKKLKYEIVKQRRTGLLVCPDCWTADHPQLMLGTFPVNDPQALRNPRPLQLVASRVIQWGWNPVGMASIPGLVSTIEAVGSVGTVTVQTS